MDDVPNDEVIDLLLQIADLFEPRPVDELEGPIRTDALDQVGCIFDDRAVALLALDEPAVFPIGRRDGITHQVPFLVVPTHAAGWNIVHPLERPLILPRSSAQW